MNSKMQSAPRAARLDGLHRSGSRSSSTTTSSPGASSRTSSAPMRSSAQRLRGEDPVAVEAARARAAGSRRGSRKPTSFPSARRTAENAPSIRAIVAGDGLLERPRVAGDQGGDDLGVRGRREPRPFGAGAPARSSLGVREVAVVAERDGPRRARAGRSAARWPSASSRSSSSARARSRPGRAGRAASARRRPA